VPSSSRPKPSRPRLTDRWRRARRSPPIRSITPPLCHEGSAGSQNACRVALLSTLDTIGSEGQHAPGQKHLGASRLSRRSPVAAGGRRAPGLGQGPGPVQADRGRPPAQDSRARQLALRRFLARVGLSWMSPPTAYDARNRGQDSGRAREPARSPPPLRACQPRSLRSPPVTATVRGRARRAWPLLAPPPQAPPPTVSGARRLSWGAMALHLRNHPAPATDLPGHLRVSSGHVRH